MQNEMMRKEVLNRLKERPKTLSEISVEAKVSEAAIKDTIMVMMSEGAVSQDQERYFVPSGNGSPVAGTAAKKKPLSPEERKSLRAAESRIDKLVGDIESKQLEVAGELRKIRDGKLYRETHERFQDYVEGRFGRTRDWAYKAIRQLEVDEGLKTGEDKPGVDAHLQTATARETPHLAKLKKDPAKMKAALQKAEDKAKKENRERTPKDVKEAVEAMKGSGKKPDQAAPKAPCKVRTVEFSGVNYDDQETADVAAVLADFAKWLRQHPTETAFTIKVGEAFVAQDQG